MGRILADGSGNFVGIIKNLQVFVTALRDSNAADRAVQRSAGDAVQRARRQQVRPRRARCTNLSVGDRRGEAVRRGHPQPDRRAAPGAGQGHPDPGRRQGATSSRCCTSRRTRSPTRYNIYDPDTGSPRGGFSIPNFASPMQFVCGMIGATQNTTAPETAKLCNQYLGPGAAVAQPQLHPGSDQPVPGASRPARRTSSTPTRSWRPAARAAAPRAPENPPPVSAYTGSTATSRRRQAWARRRRSVPGHRPPAAAPFPALYPGAPVPTDPPQIGPPVPPPCRRRPAAGPSLPGMLLPAEAPPRRTRRLARRCLPRGTPPHDEWKHTTRTAVRGGHVRGADRHRMRVPGHQLAAAAGCGGAWFRRGDLPRRRSRISLRWSRIRRS